MLEGRTLLSAGHPQELRHAPVKSAGEARPTYVLAATSKQDKSGGRTVTPDYSTSPVGMTPAQVRKAYAMDQVTFGTVQGDGSGQTIAIVDAYHAPTAYADLLAFDKAFGLSDPPLFKQVAQDGTTNFPSTDPAGAGNPNGTWESETALDVEWAHAMAPKANILLVEANDASYTNLIQRAENYARSQPGVSVVSMSFGGGEFSTETQLDRYFTTPTGHAGVTFVASTGDTGAPGGYPSWSPNVVAVGGTSLHTDAAGNYLSESAWSSGGGGISVYEAKPSYQKGVVTQSATKRVAPDVSMDADPYTGVAVYDSFDNAAAPWMQIGGTSLAAPMFAGVVAVTNQGRATQGLSPLDGASQTLPKLYSVSASDFHDVTSGNNGFAAGVGYDAATGRGTPIATKLVPDLAGLKKPAAIALAAGGANTVVVKADADGVHADVTVDGTLQQVDLTTASQLTFTGADGNDSFTFDFSAGNPLPSGGASIDGGAGANSLTLIGTSGNDVVTATASGVTVTGGTFSNVPIQVANVQALGLTGGSGGSDALTLSGGNWQVDADTTAGTPNVTVNVQSGATAVFANDQHLAGLNIAGGSVQMAAGSRKTLSAGALSISNGGKLDLNVSDLLTTTPIATIRSYLLSAYTSNQDWAGSGITSSVVRGDPVKSSLAYVDGSDPNVALAGITQVNGQAVPTGEVLVRPTLNGDFNLDGVVNDLDLQVFSGLGQYNKPGTDQTWLQGDLNYDGKVDDTDLLFFSGAGNYNDGASFASRAGLTTT